MDGTANQPASGPPNRVHQYPDNNAWTAMRMRASNQNAPSPDGWWSAADAGFLAAFGGHRLTWKCETDGLIGIAGDGAAPAEAGQQGDVPDPAVVDAGDQVLGNLDV